MNLRLPIAATLALIAGCATAPKPLQGDFVSRSPREPAALGERVRWGGAVIAVEPQSGRTCFQILARSLAANGRPRETDDSEGRFLACRAGFYDPAVFTAGREVTVVGSADGSESRTVGDYPLDLPRVAAEAIHLWPQRVDTRYRYAPNHFWSPLGHHGWWWPSIRYHRVPHVRAREAAPTASPPDPQ